MAGYFEEPPKPSQKLDYREWIEAVDSSLKTAEREQSARGRQSRIYDAARKNIQKMLEDEKKVLGDEPFSRSVAQERMTPSELNRWSKRISRTAKSLEKTSNDTRLGTFERDTEDAARQAKEDAGRRSLSRSKAIMEYIEATTSQIAADTQINLSKALKSETVKSSRDEEKRLEISMDKKLASISADETNAIVNEDFFGGNYTNKIRRSREKLNRELERCLRLGEINGWSVDRISKEMSKRISINERESYRLLRTEMTRVSNEAALEQLKSSGAKFYKYISIMDSRTCERCKALHGHVFPIDGARVSVNMPPLHPNCRCRIVFNYGSDSQEAMFSPNTGENNENQSLMNLPAPAYMRREETGFNEQVLSAYKAPGVMYRQFMPIYIDSMKERGIPDDLCSVVERIYTKSVWDKVPPAHLQINKHLFISVYHPVTNDIEMAVNSGEYAVYDLTHELTHLLDRKVFRSEGVNHRLNRMNIAFSRDAKIIDREGIYIGGIRFTKETIKKIASEEHISGELMEFRNAVLDELGYDLPSNLTIYLMSIVFDSLQSLLGKEYGLGHTDRYCDRTAGTFLEVVAHCGTSYIWGFKKVFSRLFPNGYSAVEGWFRELAIKPFRRTP